MCNTGTILRAIAATLVAATAAAQSAAGALRGMVLDASGAPVPAALILVESAEGVRTTRTDAAGRFIVEVSHAGECRIRARAEGFAEVVVRVTPDAIDAAELRLVLQPAGISETVTVAASPGVEPLATPASVSVLAAANLLTGAAPFVDDVLRFTPGFSLFRRSSSRVANPSAQGVTLRGISGSGASRTLVLADGLPLNDAFGSWVYWNRIPVASIERVEVLRGATGDLYGADALGGVIQLFTFRPTRSRLRVITEAGSHGTARGSAFAGAPMGPLALTAAGEWSVTDGVPVVARSERGAVDVAAGSDYRSGLVDLGARLGGWEGRGRVHTFQEVRSNGTTLVGNDTNWRQWMSEASGPLGGGALLVRVAAARQRYFNNFSAVAADRASERLTRAQRIPSRTAALSGQWVRPWSRGVLILGGERRRAEATIHETRFAPTGAVAGVTVAGGTETSSSLFGRVHTQTSESVTLAAGLRLEAWRSHPARLETPTHRATLASPYLSAAWRLTDQVALRGAVARAHRTPTLNELHRGFRVGDIVTDPNPLLDPEHLAGFEAGVLFAGTRGSARVTGFYNRLTDLVANVTVAVTPGLIRRQKQNAERVRTAGLELEADVRPHPFVNISLSAAVTAATFLPAAAGPALAGRRVPQVPGYQIAAGVTYADPDRVTATLQLRAVGSQYDDDLNEFRLDEFAVVDGFASRRLGRGVHGFLAVENLFDVEYDVGRTPIRTVGWPRTIRGGVRVFWP